MGQSKTIDGRTNSAIKRLNFFQLCAMIEHNFVATNMLIDVKINTIGNAFGHNIFKPLFGVIKVLRQDSTGSAVGSAIGYLIHTHGK
jgi:hypothetical protein